MSVKGDFIRKRALMALLKCQVKKCHNLSLTAFKLTCINIFLEIVFFVFSCFGIYCVSGFLDTQYIFSYT